MHIQLAVENCNVCRLLDVVRTVEMDVGDDESLDTPEPHIAFIESDLIGEVDQYQWLYQTACRGDWRSTWVVAASRVAVTSRMSMCF